MRIVADAVEKGIPAMVKKLRTETTLLDAYGRDYRNVALRGGVAWLIPGAVRHLPCNAVRCMRAAR